MGPTSDNHQASQSGQNCRQPVTSEHHQVNQGASASQSVSFEKKQHQQPASHMNDGFHGQPGQKNLPTGNNNNQGHQGGGQQRPHIMSFSRFARDMSTQGPTGYLAGNLNPLPFATNDQHCHPVHHRDHPGAGAGGQPWASPLGQIYHAISDNHQASQSGQNLGQPTVGVSKLTKVAWGQPLTTIRKQASLVRTVANLWQVNTTKLTKVANPGRVQVANPV